MEEQQQPPPPADQLVIKPEPVEPVEPEPEPEPRPAVHGRFATLSDLRRDGYMPTYAEGVHYDTVRLGADAKDVERNSVLLLPNLLSAAECAQLIDDVDVNGIEDAKTGSGGGFERHSLAHLSASTSTLFDKVLRERLLPFVSAKLPAVEDYLWARSTREAVDAGRDGMTSLAPTEARTAGTLLGELPYRFTPKEPAINRYSDGGEFSAHTDQQGLTINILLRDGSFEGGGTAFWEEGATPPWQGGDPSTLCLQPTAGVGVLFNGTVKHAGRPVTAGVRHLLVASFSITNARFGSSHMSKRSGHSGGYSSGYSITSARYGACA
jgi:hypothetical protein